MRRWWISWQQPTEDYRPIMYPPNAAILGWWNSGSGEEYWTLCAVVQAETERQAMGAIKLDWPEADVWRFCTEKPADFLPGDRFPLSNWMRERIHTK